jgi:undecaprenyl-diphosphatase
MSAAVILTLAVLIARSHARLVDRTYIVASGTLIVVLVGVSRAALGVHWATDVVGGWTFGTAWATAWLLVAEHFDPARLAASVLEAPSP